MFIIFYALYKIKAVRKQRYQLLCVMLNLYVIKYKTVKIYHEYITETWMCKYAQLCCIYKSHPDPHGCNKNNKHRGKGNVERINHICYTEYRFTQV